MGQREGHIAYRGQRSQLLPLFPRLWLLAHLRVGDARLACRNHQLALPTFHQPWSPTERATESQRSEGFSSEAAHLGRLPASEVSGAWHDIAIDAC
jgi:hypothetical protein